MFARYQECSTLTMPAFDPQNLTAYNEELYTFEASWEPNDPKARLQLYVMLSFLRPASSSTGMCKRR